MAQEFEKSEKDVLGNENYKGAGMAGLRLLTNEAYKQGSVIMADLGMISEATGIVNEAEKSALNGSFCYIANYNTPYIRISTPHSKLRNEQIGLSGRTALGLSEIAAFIATSEDIGNDVYVKEYGSKLYAIAKKYIAIRKGLKSEDREFVSDSVAHEKAITKLLGSQTNKHKVFIDEKKLLLEDKITKMAASIPGCKFLVDAWGEACSEFKEMSSTVMESPFVKIMNPEGSEDHPTRAIRIKYLESIKNNDHSSAPDIRFFHLAAGAIDYNILSDATLAFLYHSWKGYLASNRNGK